MVFASAVPAASSLIPPAALDASTVIMAAYGFAALVFMAAWAVQVARGKPSPGRFSPAAPALPGGPDERSLSFPERSPDPDASPYATPATLPPPLPVAETSPPPGRWKVPIGPYRLLDLPLIGLVFLVYFGLTAMPTGGDEIPLEEKFTPEVLVASIVFQLLLMGMVISFVIWRVRLSEWLGLRWKLWPLAFAIAPLTVFFMWCFMGAVHLSGWNAWLERSLGIESMQEAVKLLQEAKDPRVVVLMAIAAVIVAPVAEEVVFRGYLYPAAKSFCGPAGAIIFSSLVFAAAHGNVVALLPLFLLAVLLCLLYEFTGSIWACISVHFLFNAATVGLQLLARSGLVEIPATE
jgi:membrane protease YdiL (CAAX protease family)